MGNEFIELQDNLIDYFEDVENKMLCDFIDVFVYGNGTQDTKVSKFSDKFLTDNGLVNAYINAMHDINNPKQYFLRSSLSERTMIQDIKQVLLSIAFHRFNKTV